MLSDFVFKLKYANFNPVAMRRESWNEAADRMIDMHIQKFPMMQTKLNFCRTLVHDKKVVGSQRALQFGGDAILERNVRIFNCASSYADRPRFFAEYLWLLMSGVGAGFSIQSHHVSQLPLVRQPQTEVDFEIEDSTLGFTQAVEALTNAYFGEGARPNFKFDLIRPRGSKLRFGGKAPGAEPIKKALSNMENILKDNISKKLTPFAVFQCAMYLAESVGQGGSRRCATIATFDIDDEMMLKSKTGNWYETHPEFSCANISAVGYRPTVTRDDFDNIFQYTKMFGEPAIIFQSSKEFTYNPCVEALMCPMLIKYKGETVENYTLDLIEFSKRQEWQEKGYTFESGWQLCNLSSINVAKLTSEKDFEDCVFAATTLGTLQSAYTDMGFLGDVSRQIVERENLLGVSLSGVMDTPHLALNPQTLQKMAKYAVSVNEETARMIGVRPSSRVTLEKPEGTTSLVFESSAGLHTRHGHRYIRRVSCDKNDPLLRFYEAYNPHAVQEASYPKGAKIVAFAEEAPQGALTRHDLTAVEFMEKSKIVFENWILFGNRPNRLESGTHNVSMTVSVRPSEWQDVQNYLWENRATFCGVSFLEMGGDYVYENPPFQEVYAPNETSTDAERSAWDFWNALRTKTVYVDYDSFYEGEDITDMAGEVACGGGKCLI
jgi:ribonucleoside-diphosphate reductase alpha chain